MWLEAELRHRLADMLRLVRVELVGPPGRDIAEGAGARADGAEDHHRRVLLLPALADIGAGRLLADGVELELAHQLARLVILAARLGALTRIQAGLRGIGLSGLCAFSGWRRCSSCAALSRPHPDSPIGHQMWRARP